jgi:hypothetical protein
MASIHAATDDEQMWARVSTISPPVHPETATYFVTDPELPATLETMYTGHDVYRHMEVVIVKGPLKQCIGTIVASLEKDGRKMFVVRTTHRVINGTACLEEDEIRER